MDKSSTGFRWREILIQGTLLVIPLFLVFPWTFLRGEQILPGGLLYEVPPWSHNAPEGVSIPKNWLPVESLIFFNKAYLFTQEALSNGEWPLWNHYEYLGMPLLANFQSNPFYPPRLLHSFIGHYTAMTIYILLKLWLCGMCAYVCGRGMGLRVAASRFFSFAWMLSGYNLTWDYWPEPDTAAWAPIVLLGAEFLVNGRHARGFFAMATGATLMLSAGHPETAFVMGSSVGIYFFLRLLFVRPRWSRLWRCVGLAGSAWLVALLLSAPTILPFIEYLSNTQTVGSRLENEWERRYLPLGSVLGMWVPRFYGLTAEGNYWSQVDPFYYNSKFIRFMYPGMAVWLGIAALFSRGRARVENRQRVVCLVVPMILGFLLAPNLELMRPIRDLPLLSSMWRIWHMAFPMFAIAMMGALGMEKWLSSERRFRDLRGVVLLFMMVACLILSVRLFQGPVMQALKMADFVDREIWTALVIALACMAVMAASCIWRRRAAVFVTALTLLLAADVAYSARGLNPTSPQSWLFPRTALTDYLLSIKPEPRVGVVTAGLRPSLIPAYGIEQLWGYDGIYPHRNIEFLGRLGIPTAEVGAHMEPLCSVQYYLHDTSKPYRMPFDDPSRFELQTELDGLAVYKNLHAFPRAFMVGKAEVITDVDALFDAMLEPDYDPARLALLEAQPASRLPNTESTDLGSASVVRRTATHVRVEARAKEDCILVLTDAYYPGWRAKVDGAPVELFPAYYIFRALVLPAGDHVVEYEMVSWPFLAGMAVATATLVVMLVLSIVVLLRCRRSRLRATSCEP